MISSSAGCPPSVLISKLEVSLQYSALQGAASGIRQLSTCVRLPFGPLNEKRSWLEMRSAQIYASSAMAPIKSRDSPFRFSEVFPDAPFRSANVLIQLRRDSPPMTSTTGYPQVPIHFLDLVIIESVVDPCAVSARKAGWTRSSILCFTVRSRHGVTSVLHPATAPIGGGRVHGGSSWQLERSPRCRSAGPRAMCKLRPPGDTAGLGILIWESDSV